MKKSKTGTDWEKECEAKLKKYPPLNDFMQMWGKHCGAHPDTFLGHLCRMLDDCREIDESSKTSIQEAADFDQAVFHCNGIELFQAITSTLEEDTLMALRFLYYCKAYSAIPDHRYDEAEKTFLSKPEVEESPLMNPGSDNADDYPERARALGFYLMLVTEARRKNLR